MSAVLLTFKLADGSTRSKVCDHIEALEQIAQAQLTPGLWLDFSITDPSGIDITKEKKP